LLVLGIICSITGLFSLNVAAFIGGAVFVILKVFEYVSKTAALLPFADIHTGNLGLIFAVLYYILIILLLTDKLKGFKKTAIISADVMCISALLLGNRFVLKNNVIDFIDVGQGDSAIVRTYDGGVYVFDTGGIYTDGDNTGKNIIIPYLDYYGKDTIDVLFISHPDNDHCGGAVELMENINVRKLVVAGYDYGENALLESMLSSAEENGVEVERINAGYKAEGKGGFEFECIYPLSSKLSPEDDDNNGSMVIKLKCGDRSMLFTGDIDENDEKFLLFAETDLKCDVLKVSHHGSKYSSTEEFINKTDADFAVISCGENNTYGHPDGEVVKRLEDKGSKVFITAENGAVRFITNGKTLKAEE
ncbi:MAG: MBL fold metallo-hydrolase, partial [Firmicutes bacterium]|nr:MBL fold metallo-hydrolase [Bacillota bacterium]